MLRFGGGFFLHGQPERFGPGILLRIRENGLPVYDADAAETADKLQETLSLNRWTEPGTKRSLSHSPLDGGTTFM